jgi:hypothetical protein
MSSLGGVSALLHHLMKIFKWFVWFTYSLLLLDEVPPNFFIFFGATCQFDWPITQKKRNYVNSPKQRFYFEVHSSSLLAHLYRWKEDAIFQGIWDKSQVVWKTYWGKHCKFGELEGNIVQTHWKAMKNEKKKEKKVRSLNTCRCCGGCCLKQCHKIKKWSWQTKH